MSRKAQGDRAKESSFAVEGKPACSVEYMSLTRFKEAIFGVIDMWTETMQVGEYAALLAEILNRANEQTTGRYGPANYIEVRLC
jgi:hypothetical protein